MSLLSPAISLKIRTDITLTRCNKNPVREILQAYEDLLSSSHKSLKAFYTDASQTNKGTGCSIVHDRLIIEYAVPCDFSVFSVELTALKLAVRQAIDMQYSEIVIFVDYLTAVQNMNEAKTKRHPVSEEINATIYRFDLDITLCWIPSHSDIPGNNSRMMEHRSLAARWSDGRFPSGYVRVDDP